MQSQNYQRTMTACFIAYMVQAVVNNFVPLLFVTFQQTYDIPMAKITLLITLNFLIQLVIDLLSAGFVDKIGYRASVILAHICAAAGFVLLTILPEMLSDPFVGILIAVMIYAVGGGLIEVLISPIVEACPTDNKEKAMSLLHSFYCWGHVGVVLLSTAFFASAGINNWKILTILWALLPLANLVLFAGAAIYSLHEENEAGAGERIIPAENILDPYDNDALRGRVRAGGQPVGIAFCGKRTECDKDDRRSRRPDVFCRVNGNFAPVIWKIRRKMGSQPIYGRKLCAVRLFVPLHRLCAKCRGQFIGLCGLRFFCGNPLAGDIQ